MSYNLDYIFKISKGDAGFVDQFWSIVRKEWPLETEEYRRYIDEGQYNSAASIVHKLKHKFVLLSAIKGYELANLHENSLKEGSTQYVDDFNKVLIDVTQFINNTNPQDL